MGKQIDVGEAKTIYVKADDLPLWRRAVAFAKARRLTMSALIMTALERYLAEENDDQVSPPSE